MSHDSQNPNPLEPLAELKPEPNPQTRARHIAAARAAFDQAQADHANAADEKNISAAAQGIAQSPRPTPETNQQGNKVMQFHQKNAGQKRFWQNPAWLSAIAASSITVVGALFLMQRHMIDDFALADRTAESRTQVPLPTAAMPELKMDRVESAADEVVVTGSRAAPSDPQFAEVESEDIGAMPDAGVAESLQRIASEAGARKEVASNDLARRSAEKKMALAMVAQPAPQVVGMAAPAPALSDTIAPSAPKAYRDRFSDFEESPVIATADNTVSTFSIDVDTASYSFMRRMLNQGQLPPKDAVRVEELINYFDYAYPLPKSKTEPFTTNLVVTDSPWTKGNKLVHIGIQGYQLAAAEIPQSNLVFLLDVSGSMDSPDKLPLVKQSMELLLQSLKPEDTVAIVVYAGAAGTVLEPTKVKDKAKILASLTNLQAGGSTAGAEGIALAYQLAEANFNPKGVNRIILATDGDFNVGETGDENLQDFVERKREKGIYLSVLGFGQGNYQDALMQTLAQNGNGTAAYIDTLSEAQKVLVTEATSSLFPIAKDVKIQVEFNPATVKEYRLLGYETRALKREDFANDKVDAGEVGAGQRVTAIYEITPAGASGLLEPSRYQNAKPASDSKSTEYGIVRLRYKLPSEDKSRLLEQPIALVSKTNSQLQREANFATAVAGFAQLLKGSKYAGDFTYDKVIDLAQKNKGADPYGYRTEFIQLVRKAKIAKAL